MRRRLLVNFELKHAKNIRSAKTKSYYQILWYIIVLDVPYEHSKRDDSGQGAIERDNRALSHVKNIIRPQFHGVGNN